MQNISEPLRCLVSGANMASTNAVTHDNTEKFKV